MSRKRLSMRKIREVLRLSWGQYRSIREVAVSCSLARSTVKEYLRRAEEAGLAWPLPDVDDASLEKMLFPPPVEAAPGGKPLPDWDYLDKELRKRRGVTRFLLWQEYRSANPEGYAYSMFCDLFREWRGLQELSMRQEHRAGEKVFVDYAGQTIAIVDPATGEVRDAQVFLGVMGASSFAYCEATWSQGLSDWIGSHVRMLSFFGGCPEIIVPDNLKSGVKDPHLYEPELNPTYLEFARHYGLAVIPARKGHPKDKAKVESGVRTVGNWILARLRNRTFFSLAEANDSIHALLLEYNDRAFQKRPGSRRSLFEELDKPALSPLPAVRYEFAEWHKVRPHIDYHVRIEQHHYSVPYQVRKRELDARVTATTVEVFHKNLRVASHPRSHRKGAHTTVREHMPEAHRQYAEWTPERLLGWAEKIGPNTRQLIEGVMEARAHPQQAFRSCLGILRLAKTHADARLEAACRRALALGSLSYRSIEAILKNGLDQQPLEFPQPDAMPRIEHQNIRGGNYYASKPKPQGEDDIRSQKC
jgi:transposase